MLKIFQSFEGKWGFQRDIIHFSITFQQNKMMAATSPAFSCLKEMGVEKFNEARSSNEHMTVTGTAYFKRIQENVFQYSEEGILKKSDGSHFNVSRRYIYQYQDEKIKVFFDEQPERLLHTLNFVSDCLATAEHLCHEDLYNANYEFISSQEFKLTYMVSGPRKNYRMTTIFKKLPEIPYTEEISKSNDTRKKLE